MKKLITFTLCIAMALTLAAFGTYTDTQEENPIIGGDPATWGPAEYETLAEATKACGFDFSVPDTVSGYENKLFTVFNNGLIQVIYFNEEELNSLIIRKAPGNDDISGDYNKYAETSTISVNDLEITTKGNDGTINVAIWTNNDYTFAITTNNSMSGEQISELIKNIQ